MWDNGTTIKGELKEVFVFRNGDSWFYWVDDNTSTGPFASYEEARQAWADYIKA